MDEVKIQVSAFIKVLPKISDFRNIKSRIYPISLLIFCLFITELKNCRRQRQRARFLEENWEWIYKLWVSKIKKDFEQNIKETEITQSPSQSTLSRVLKNVDIYSITEQYQLERRLVIKKSEQNETAKMLLKHYCFDGKSRKGIVSKETGRTEMDVTLFDVNTREVLAQRVIPDKEGESTVAHSILKRVGRNLIKGVITGDAAFATPKITKTVINTGHEYLFCLKGNAGEVHTFCINFNWENVKTIHETLDNAHGRIEVRRLKRLALTKATSKPFEKYSRCSYIYCVESERTDNKVTSIERRFFIASKGLQGISGNILLKFIRDHWLQENGLHWVKDAILGEDSSFKMSNRSSQVLGFFKNIVVSIGYSMFKSVQEFIDRFSANPQKYIEKIICCE